MEERKTDHRGGSRTRLKERKEHVAERREELHERLDRPVSSRPRLARLSKADVVKFSGLLAFFVLVAIACVAMAPIVAELTEPGGVDRVIEQVRDAGALGVFILLGMQLLQIIVAFIPGEVVQVAAGMMFGPWWGALIILVGCVISSAFIYMLVSRLGAPFVQAMIPEKWMAKLHDFDRSDKLDAMVFILFLIPGLPKDTFTYLVPLTGMDIRAYLFLSNLGRVPGILMSTFAANGLMEGDYLMSILIFAAAGLLAVLGIVFREKIMKLFRRKEES